MIYRITTAVLVTCFFIGLYVGGMYLVWASFPHPPGEDIKEDIIWLSFGLLMVCIMILCMLNSTKTLTDINVGETWVEKDKNPFVKKRYYKIIALESNYVSYVEQTGGEGIERSRREMYFKRDCKRVKKKL